MSFDLLLKFLPCFLSTALFRIISITIMFVYLDLWSVIPCLILLTTNLMVFGISFKRFSPVSSHSEEDEVEMSSIVLNRISTMDFAAKPLEFGSSHSDLPRTPTEEEKMTNVIGWVPPNNLNSLQPPAPKHLRADKYHQVPWNPSLGILSPPTPSPNMEMVTEHVATQPEMDLPDARGETRVNLLERMQSLISSSDKTDTPNYINEDNTSIFLNSITGMFFPSCHTHLEVIGSDLSSSDPGAFFIRNKERQEKLLVWQCGVYQRQVYLYNSLLMVMLAIITILVTGVQSFNYYSNVMDSFWFVFIMIMIMFSGLISILMTWSLTRNISKYCFTDSNLQIKNLFTRFIKSIISLSVVLLPIIISLIVFLSVVRKDPYVFLINQSSSDNVQLSIITAYPVTAPGRQMNITRGNINIECYITDDLRRDILVINATRATCKTLLNEEGFYSRAVKAGAKAIILLDDTPESLWRVSSPMSEKIDSLVGSSVAPGDNIPFLLMRRDDWTKFDTQILELDRNSQDLFIVWNDPESLDLEHIFSCSSNNSVTIETSDTSPQHCSEGKHLYPDGVLSEKICVSGQCSVLGKPCPHSVFDKLRQFSVAPVCDSLRNINLEISKKNSPALRPELLANVRTGQRWEKEYCCNNDNSREFNSTFVEVLGEGCFNSWREVRRHLEDCEWTDWIQGECVQEQRKTYRLCLVSAGCLNVIRESYDTLCYSNIVLEKCRNSPFQCDS